MTKNQQVVSKLESIKTKSPNDSLIDTNLKYFKFVSSVHSTSHVLSKETSITGNRICIHRLKN